MKSTRQRVGAKALPYQPGSTAVRASGVTVWQRMLRFCCVGVFASHAAPLFSAPPVPIASALPGEFSVEWLQDDRYVYDISWVSCRDPKDCRRDFRHDVASPFYAGPFAAGTTLEWQLRAYSDQRTIEHHSSGQLTIGQAGLKVVSSYPSAGRSEWQPFEPIAIDFGQIIRRLDTGTITIQPIDGTERSFSHPGLSVFRIAATSPYLRVDNSRLFISPHAYYRSGYDTTGVNPLFGTSYEIRLDRAIEAAVNQATMHGYPLLRFKTRPLSLFSSQHYRVADHGQAMKEHLDTTDQKALEGSHHHHRKSALSGNGRAFRGRGVRVAIMDEGILRSGHADSAVIWRLKQLDDRYLLPLGQAEQSNHGSLMAAFVLDYAPAAALLDFHVFAGPDHTVQPLAVGFRNVGIEPFHYATLARHLGADILNVSLISRQFQHRLEDWAAAIRAGLIISKSLGNQRDHPNIWSQQQCLDPANLLPYFYRLHDAVGAIVTLQAVQLVGKNYVSLRARADDAQSYTLSVLETGSGATSQAAATFSGMVAALLEASRFYNRPYTPRQIVALMLETATDIGDPGVDPIFGRGLINVEAALKRIQDGHAPNLDIYAHLEEHAAIPHFQCRSSM